MPKAADPLHGFRTSTGGWLVLIVGTWLIGSPAAANEHAPLSLAPDRSHGASSADGPHRLVPAAPGSQSSSIEVGRISGPRFRGPSSSDSGADFLGPDPWAGTDPAVAEALVGQLPIGAPSPTMGQLMRAVLLAPDPDQPRSQPFFASQGGAYQVGRPADLEMSAFLTQRLARLQEAGHIEDAAALAAQVTGATASQQVATRIQAVAALLEREEAEACQIGLRMRLESDDPFWVKLRAFCYLLKDAGPAAQLTADILVERGVDAPLFHALVLALSGRADVPEEAWQEPLTALAYAMTRHAGLALPQSAIATAEPAVLRAIAMDIDGAADDGEADDGVSQASFAAIEAAERSVLTGALEPTTLAHAYRRAFASDDAPQDPLAVQDDLAPSAANALFYQVIERETVPASRIELLAAALKFARNHGMVLPVALVYGDTLQEIAPDPDLAWAARELGLAALIADQAAVAYRWRDVMALRADRGGSEQDAEALRQLNVALAVAAPDSTAGRGPDLDMDGWIRAAMEDGSVIDPLVLQQDLILLNALGQPLTPGARAWLVTHAERRSGDSRPPPAVDAMVEHAVTNGRLAEAVSLAMILAGREGPFATSVERMVRAIQTLMALGMQHEARRLALETLLARPDAGARP